MSVDIAYLKTKGVSSDAYRGIFAQTPDKWGQKVRRLINNISARIRDGLNTSVDNHVAQAYCAIDAAYNIPYKQTTPTLINEVLSRFHGAEDEPGIREALRQWGVDDESLWLKVRGADGRETGACVPNPPVFFNVVPNLVKAYVTSVLGRLFNARNKTPLLDFKPSRQTEEDELLCGVITDSIDKISSNLGYADILKASIEQMLKYGVNITFPREEWYKEQQQHFTGKKDALGNRESKSVMVRQGIRYFLPHPTRFYYDLKYPLTSLNSDTGVEFLGHWHVLSYGQILDNELLWNRDHIFAGTNWFKAPLQKFYYQEIFPCNLQFPGTFKYWTEPVQREDKAQIYMTADRDKAIYVAEHYEKLIPADWGLGDYPHPVWHRFMMAGDDTPVFVEPKAYCPSWTLLYDYSENNDRMPSLALEVIPWQDWLGNILSQILLTAKQNLQRIIFYDTNLVDAKDIERLKNEGERLYRGTVWVPLDSIAHRIPKLEGQNAFFPVNLGQASVAEMFSTLNVFLNIMQRVLLIAAQGTGSAGPHQQGKQEIAMLQQATADRELLIGSAVDAGIDAWKRQIFNAARNYADPEFEAEVDASTPGLEESVEKLGFKLVKKGKQKAIIAGDWRQIELMDFARTSEGDTAEENKEGGQAMMNVIGMIASHPDMYKQVGAENVKLLLEFAAKLLGAPETFRLRAAGEDDKGGEVDPKVIEAIKSAQTATLQAVEEKIGKPAAQQVGKAQQEITQLQQQVQQLEKLSQLAQQLVNKQNVEAQKAQQKSAAEAQAAQAEEARKNHELQAEEQRKNLETAARIEREKRESEARIALEQKQTAARIENDQTMAQAKANAAPKKSP
jgi:hypothetical protein